LQLHVEVLDAELGAVHRREHLDVLERIESETSRDALADHRDHAIDYDGG